ncbi:hypothetical protein V6N13_040029 [Hibiscus sabdariffa]
MNVKTTFLNGEVDEEIYMEQPLGFEAPGMEGKVCRLKKSFYGLKQAPKQWYEKFHKTILSFGFVVNGSDACLYLKIFGTDCVIISLYVDDMLIFSPNIESINKTKSFLSIKFDMTDLGEVDKLNFIGFPAVLEGYCDANWVSDNDEVSSMSGYIFTLGGAAISWKSSKQTCIARSTMESEFITLDLVGQEAEWLRNLSAEIPLWERLTPPVSLLCNSQAAISVAKNQAYNGKKRHIHIRHGSVRHLIRNGVLSLEYVRSERNLAYPLTKGLSRKLVLDSSRGIGLKPIG